MSYLKKHRKSGPGAQLRLNAYVVPFLGEKLLAELKDTDFERWLDWVEGHTPKGRRSDKPHYVRVCDGASSARLLRRATACRHSAATAARAATPDRLRPIIDQGVGHSLALEGISAANLARSSGR